MVAITDWVLVNKFLISYTYGLRKGRLFREFHHGNMPSEEDIIALEEELTSNLGGEVALVMSVNLISDRHVENTAYPNI